MICPNGKCSIVYSENPKFDFKPPVPTNSSRSMSKYRKSIKTKPRGMCHSRCKKVHYEKSKFGLKPPVPVNSYTRSMRKYPKSINTQYMCDGDRCNMSTVKPFSINTRSRMSIPSRKNTIYSLRNQFNPSKKSMTRNRNQVPINKSCKSGDCGNKLTRALSPALQRFLENLNSQK